MGVENRSFEPWKITVCQQPGCLSQAFTENGQVREGFHLQPDIDTPQFTQFTCPRCGHVETWGLTRRSIAKILWRKSRA